MKLLIAPFDRTGNSSRPYKEAGWMVWQIDIQHGYDFLNFDPRSTVFDFEKIGLIAPLPCTDYAVSGAKHFEAKDADGRTEESQKLVAHLQFVIEYLRDMIGRLDFWQIENPKTRIHKLNEWIGQRPKYVFNPCDFAGYNPDNPEDDRYNKETWLFGKFNDPVKKRLEPLGKEYPGFKNLGGKSLETKNARSITPLGFAFAFFEANH